MGRWVGQKMAKKSDILYGWPLGLCILRVKLYNVYYSNGELLD